jgi:O-antigen/teichoic acid export membrane protein
LFVIACVVLPGSLSGIALSILWGRQRYRPVAITLLVASTAQMAMIATGYVLDWSLTGFLAAALSLNVVQAAGLLMILGLDRADVRTIAVALPQRTTVRRFTAFLIPATLSQLVTMIVWERSEVFFLERFSTLTQVGVYSLAFTIVALGLTLGWALIGAFYPAISSDYGAQHWAGIQEKLSQGTILAALYAVPVMFGGWVVLDRVIALLYGAKMLDAVPVAMVLFAGMIPGVVGGMLGITIGAVGGMWLLVRVGVGISVVNIVLALVLIPQFGALGAAIANTGSQFVHVALLVGAITSTYRLNLPWRSIGKLIALGLLTTFLLPTLLQDAIPGLFGLGVAVTAAGITYAIGVWALGYVRDVFPVSQTPVPTP